MIILLLIFLLSFVSGCSDSQSQTAPESESSATAPIVTVETASATYRELDRFVEAVGTLDPNEEVTVSNQVEGQS